MHNSRVRNNRANLRISLRSLSQHSEIASYNQLYESVLSLAAARDNTDQNGEERLFADVALRDTSNSVNVLRSLLGIEDNGPTLERQLGSSRIAETLEYISSDLSSRWAGAIYALDPRNPDAARHFCSSTREIVAGILDSSAPDSEVLNSFPDCPLTPQGTPTRRAKVHYCLDRRGIVDGPLENFLEANVSDLNILLKDLNAGTHGPPGKYSLPQLAAIKTRAEDAIEFLCQIAA